MKKAREIKTSPDVRAYVYQQLHEFEPYIQPNTTTDVRIEKQKIVNSKNGKHDVQFTVYLNLGQLTSRASAKDVYTAISQATQSMRKQVQSIYNFTVSSNARDNEIDVLMKYRYLH